MSGVTRNAVELHDLRSHEVIEKLKLGDALLIDEISSRLYAKTLVVIDPEISTIADWQKRDEKLKWVLHTQVELLGPLWVCEDTMNALVTADQQKAFDVLRNLTYGLHFLCQEISGLFYDLGYSTWNLLDFLDPRHYCTSKDFPHSLEKKIAALLDERSSIPTGLLSNCFEKLTQGAVGRATIRLAKIQLAEWLLWSQRYKVIIQYFYESQDPLEALYAFNYTFSSAVHLLGLSLSLKLSTDTLATALRAHET